MMRHTNFGDGNVVVAYSVGICIWVKFAVWYDISNRGGIVLVGWVQKSKKGELDLMSKTVINTL